MATPADVTIPKLGSGDAALDHSAPALFARGLDELRRTADNGWTDHNVHDPGITTLELLCYALTDLVYRTSYPIADLLAGPQPDAAGTATQFYTAREILPTRPVTAADYRKLMIDVEGVKNAWIRPATETYYADTVRGTLLHSAPAGVPGVVPVPLAGLFAVLVEYVDDGTASDRASALREVKRRVHANRNLCEDFVGFDEVGVQQFILCAELELTPDADLVRTHAEILFRVQQYLSPPVTQYRLAEMRARVRPNGEQYTIDEIFAGPALLHGFIDDDELAAAELREEIHLSDVIGIMMDVDGVQAVREALVNPLGASAAPLNRWRVPVAAGQKPLLAPDASRLVFHKRGMPFVANAADVAARLNVLRQQAGARDRIVAPEDLPIPVGRFRNPSAYYSFQNHFPALYGLGEAGLVEPGDARRRALAYQLKGYLLFFDQVLADHLAQLAHARDLFAFRAGPGVQAAPDAPLAPMPPPSEDDPAGDRTYFHQVVDTFRDWETIYAAGAGALAGLATLDDPAVVSDRRNRFLDHLIARVAERFHDFVHIMRAEFEATPASAIRHKRDFLRDYPAISSERGLGYDDTRRDDAGLWNSANVSGLERRLVRLLGMPNAIRRNLGDVAHDVYSQIDHNPGDRYRFRIRRRDTAKIVLSGTTHFATVELARDEMRRALEAAAAPGGFVRKRTASGRHYFDVVDGAGDIVGRRIEYFATAALMDTAIDELQAYLHAEFGDEGMYVIESILLRPTEPGDPFLPICADPNCTDCAGEDPYSYRIRVILPAYAGRFASMPFRRFAEQVIREETPAHVEPTICWISQADMAALEMRYREWIALRAGRESADRARKLGDLIDTLVHAKNVYPAQLLHECDAPEDARKFLLGQTALGTLR